jgi:hypothetical protein
MRDIDALLNSLVNIRNSLSGRCSNCHCTGGQGERHLLNGTSPEGAMRLSARRVLCGSL